MTYVKDPDEVLDYGFDWRGGPPGPFLAADETIVGSEWEVPAGLTQVGDDTHDDTTTTIWLSGGTSGAVYTVVNRVTTSAGRTKESKPPLRIIVRSN